MLSNLQVWQQPTVEGVKQPLSSEPVPRWSDTAAIYDLQETERHVCQSDHQGYLQISDRTVADREVG